MDKERQKEEQQEKEQQEAVSAAVREFIDIKYELSLYVDEGLIELGHRFDEAITRLIRVTGTAASIDTLTL
jgi:hypothetical protein